MSKKAGTAVVAEPPARVLTPAEAHAQKQADIKAMELRFAEDRRKTLRGESDESEEEEVEEQEEEVTPPPVKKKAAAPAPEEEEEEEEDDSFDDFEDEPTPPAADDEEQEEEEEEEEPDKEPKDAKAWRERIKEQGRLRKEAEAKVITLEEEADALRTKVVELETKSKSVASSIINWNSHDSVKPKWSEFDNIVGRGARSFSDPEAAKRFRKDSEAVLLKEYYDIQKGAKDEDARIEADIKYKQALAERYEIEDAAPLVSSVRDALQKYMEIQDSIEDLKKKHDEGRLSQGVDQYDRAVKPFEAVFADLGNVDNDFIETNPVAIESVVGKRYAEDEGFRKEADKFKDRVKQFVFGLRPLTQQELDSLESRATSKSMTVGEYLKLREENFEKARAKFLNDVFYTGMAASEFPDMRRIYDKYKDNQKKRASVKKSVSKGKDATPDRPTKVEKPVKPSERPYIPPSRRTFA